MSSNEWQLQCHEDSNARTLLLRIESVAAEGNSDNPLLRLNWTLFESTGEDGSILPATSLDMPLIFSAMERLICLPTTTMVFSQE